MAKREDKMTNDKQLQEMTERFISEVTNKTYAKAYLAIKDCISQKEYCKRIKVNESRFSRVLSKVEKELSLPVGAAA